MLFCHALAPSVERKEKSVVETQREGKKPEEERKERERKDERERSDDKSRSDDFVCVHDSRGCFVTVMSRVEVRMRENKAGYTA